MKEARSECEPFKKCWRSHLYSPLTFTFFLCLLSFSQDLSPEQLWIQIPMKRRQRSVPTGPCFTNESLSVRDLFSSFAGNFKRSLKAIKPDDISSRDVPGNTLLEIVSRLDGNQRSSRTRLDQAVPAVRCSRRMRGDPYERYKQMFKDRLGHSDFGSLAYTR